MKSVDELDRDDFVYGAFWLVLIAASVIIGVVLDEPLIGVACGALLAFLAAFLLERVRA